MSDQKELSGDELLREIAGGNVALFQEATRKFIDHVTALQCEKDELNKALSLKMAQCVAMRDACGKELLERLERLERYEKALNQIAAWPSGEEVTGSFDEPASATAAREALKPTKQ